MAILLIGSTGNGKSTLGNFLIDPDSKLSPKKKFVVARNGMLGTKNCQIISTQIELNGEKKDITVIDTPGLNERASESEDLWHMINLIEQLKENKKIRACVFVVKFSSQVDAQFKTTVQYYADLLPDLFANNVVIVVTNFPTDKRAVQMREKQGIDHSEITNNIKTAIKRDACLSFEPMIFTLDSDPFDKEEMKISKSARNDLLTYIYTRRIAKVKEFTVAKTKTLLEQDSRKIGECKVEILEYEAKLHEANNKARLALEVVQSHEHLATECDSQLSVLQSKVNELDTDKLVTSTVYEVGDLWKIGWQTKQFEVQSKHHIHRYETWSNGHCQFVDVQQEPYRITGKIKGRFMRGLYATVTVYTKRKWAEANKIEELKKEISHKERERDIAEQMAQSARNEFKMHNDEVNQFDRFIEERKKTISKLTPERLSLEVARQCVRHE